MMIHSRQIILGMLAVLICVICAIGYSGSYLNSVAFADQQDRKDSQSLDGFWYSPRHYSGCFENSHVLLIEGDTIRAILANKFLDETIDISKKNGNHTIAVNAPSGNEITYFLKYDGVNFFVFKYEVRDGNEVLMIEEQQPLYTRCENPTTTGIVRSFFDKVFDPDSLQAEK